MPYSDFTLTNLRQSFQVVQQRKPLFDAVPDLPPTPWLTETLQQGMELAITTEKARSELLVMPILLASCALHQRQVSIYSGETLNAAPDQGLNGECDFILTCGPPLPELQAPIVTVVDIASSLGQCAAQVLGARLFNRQDQLPIETIHGCVTTGEAWQFLRLEQNCIIIDTKRYYIDHVEQILGVFHRIIASYSSLTEAMAAVWPDLP